MAKYLSKRQPNLNLGIVSYTENETVLEVIGNVGIKTDDTQDYELYVNGDTNIIGGFNVGGASTFVGVGTFSGDLYVGGDLYVADDIVFDFLTGTNVSYSGIGTIETLDTTTATIDFLTNTNLNTSGIGTIETLDVTTGTIDFLTNTNLNTSGIGTIETLDTTTATIDFLSNTNLNTSGIGTIETLDVTTGTIDFLSNTNLNTSGIGTIPILDTTTGTIDFLTNTNLNTSGIGTIETLDTTTGTIDFLTNTNLTSGIGTISTLDTTTGTIDFLTNTNLTSGIGTISTLDTTTGTIDFLTNTNLNTSGIGTISTLDTTTGTIDFLTNTNLTSGIGTISTLDTTTGTIDFLSGTNVSYSGIGTINTFRSNSGIITTLSGTTVTYNTGNFTTANINTGIVTTLSGTNLNYSGISTLGVTSTTNLTSQQLFVSGVSTFIGAITGTISTATKLQNARTFEITGDIVASPISFDGTGNVSLAATIQPNSVELGTNTTGDYIESISGTANEIDVTGGTGEGSTPIISFAPNPLIGGNVTIGNDLQVNNNLNVTGNITVGGTASTLFASDLFVFDRNIVLGIGTTNISNADITTDTTANGGGIAIASTEGNPLVSFDSIGVNTYSVNYKQIAWFKAGTFAGLGTDAWLINYAVGIGSTQFPSGTRLAAGAVQFTENDLAVVRNINASGIVTAPTFVGNLTGTASTASFATTAFTLDGVAEGNLSVGFARSAGVSTSVIGGIASVTQLSVSGVTTLSSVGVSQLNVSGVTTSVGGFIGNLTGTASTASFATTAFTLDGVAEGNLSVGFARSAGVSTSVIGGIASVTQLSVSGVTTLSSVGVSQLNVSGVTTSVGGFIGNLTGTATTATNLSDAANITTGTINAARLTGTYNIDISGNAATANYADIAGIATFASNAGIATYADFAGISTNVIGGIASVTQLSVSGVSTFSNDVFVGSGITMYATTGIISATAFYGDGQNLSDIIAAKLAGVTIREEGSIVGTEYQFSELNFVGDYVTATGIGSTATITFTTPPYSEVAGIATFATTAGIATYADTAGIATNVIGGIASVTQLSVSGISTFSNDVFVGSGITMYATTGIISATAFYGNGQNLTDLIQSVSVSKIDGITIQDEGNTVGTAASITKINFIGDYVTATGIGSTATITFTTPPFYGDGSNLSNTNGFSTSLSSDPSSPLYRIYKETRALNVTAGIHTVQSDSDHDNLAFTKADIIVVSTGATFEVSSGTTFRTNIIDLFPADEDLDVTAQNLNVLGISTFSGNVNVGVGTDTGLVLTSPNGSKFRLYVDDSGNLNTTSF
jgi:hypothetical protein